MSARCTGRCGASVLRSIPVIPLVIPRIGGVCHVQKPITGTVIVLSNLLAVTTKIHTHVQTPRVGRTGIFLHILTRKQCYRNEPWTTKVTDFGTNRKRAYEFILVRNNLGLISHRFGYIADLFVLLSDPTPIQLQFWGCSRCTRWPMMCSGRAQTLN